MNQNTLFPERDLLTDALYDSLNDFVSPPPAPWAGDGSDEEFIRSALASLNKCPEAHNETLLTLHAYQHDCLLLVAVLRSYTAKRNAVAHCKLRLRNRLFVLCREHRCIPAGKDGAK